jgi:hypothetical protein
MAECVPAVWKWREEERAAQQREEDGEGKEVREEGSGTQKIRRLMVATLCAGLDLKIGEEEAPQPNPGPNRRRQDSEGEDAFRREAAGGRDAQRMEGREKRGGTTKSRRQLLSTLALMDLKIGEEAAPQPRTRPTAQDKRQRRRRCIRGGRTEGSDAKTADKMRIRWRRGGD